MGFSQGGDLILEPVCENPITQADAVAACQGYHNPLVLPPLGSHVTVTGPFVLDTDHGWNQIHPLESIAVVGDVTNLPSPTPSASASPIQSAATTTLCGTISSSSCPLVS